MTHAADTLRGGGLVAFPTETVYGLGADATNPRAVAKIFAAKGRPPTNPLIVHVADARTARRYAAGWSTEAARLAERFWPGPLTLVVPKSPAIADAVTAGLPAVGLRVPDHPLALELLRAFGGPVAAPSANRSNRVSPTTAEHVREEIGGAVDLVLDGGPCRVGIESTVLDLTDPQPAVLRPGSVTREQIEQVIGAVALRGGNTPAGEAAPSPGRHAVHYAPRAPAFRLARGPLPEALAALRTVGTRGAIGLLCLPGGDGGWGGYPIVTLPETPADYARALYAGLRQVDHALTQLPSRGGTILVEMPPAGAAWEAVRDRIARATRPLPTEPETERGTGEGG